MLPFTMNNVPVYDVNIFPQIKIVRRRGISIFTKKN